MLIDGLPKSGSDMVDGRWSQESRFSFPPSFVIFSVKPLLDGIDLPARAVGAKAMKTETNQSLAILDERGFFLHLVVTVALRGCI